MKPRAAAMGDLPLRRRLPLAVAACVLASGGTCAAAFALAGLGAGALSALATGALGAAVAGLAARGALRPLGALADSVAPPSGGAGDEVARIAEAFAALTRRYDAATRRGDPARLDDPLTGLPNRLSVMRRGRDEITRARRRADPLSVALLALDPADLAALGAPEGDRALRACGEQLVQCLRAYDVVGRWEGAVLVALMPEAEVENAVAAMERAIAMIAAAGVGGALGRPARAHAGVAVLQPDDATLADIAKRAAAALDRARGSPGTPVHAAPGPRTRPATLTSV